LPVLRLAGDDFGYPQPYTFARGPGHVLTSLLFDTLIWHDAEGLIPWLATDWQLAADGRTWEFTLRSNVRWHDGTPLTAADVVFTFQYLKEKPNPWWASALELVEQVEAPAEHHVVIRTSRPYAPLLSNVAASVFILPRHIWGTIAEPRRFMGPDAVVGTGPYRLKQYDKAQPRLFPGPAVCAAGGVRPSSERPLGPPARPDRRRWGRNPGRANRRGPATVS
jgi:peptide/nickel transport system substrate-binding protein